VKYNPYFENKFQGCLHIASFHDQHRKRDAKVFMIPGDHEIVGIFDGVDCWIAPANMSAAGCDLVALLTQVRAGTFQGASPMRTPRRHINVESLKQPTTAPARIQAMARRRITNV